VKPLNLILVSGRHFDLEKRRKALARDECLVADLRERGCAVRWVYPAGEGGPDEVAGGTNGVSLLPVHTVVPGFCGVEARLNDAPLEQVLVRSVRTELPDVLHALGYGAGTSMNLPWLAERMGVSCVVTLESEEALCHRGTLINERGQECDEWNRPKRCAECCLTPFDGGLGPVGAACGRVLARLRWISPFPQELDFQNRLDLATAGLVSAQRVVVTREEDVRRLQQAGVNGQLECLVDAYDATALMDVYQAARCRARTSNLSQRELSV